MTCGSAVDNKEICGFVDFVTNVSQSVKRRFKRGLSANRSCFHVSTAVIHKRLWISGFVSSGTRSTFTDEGHPRSNGDGPLTHESFSTNERGLHQHASF